MSTYPIKKKKIKKKGKKKQPAPSTMRKVNRHEKKRIKEAVYAYKDRQPVRSVSPLDKSIVNT